MTNKNPINKARIPIFEWVSNPLFSPLLLDQLPEELADVAESAENLLVASTRTLLEGGVTLLGILDKGVLE